MAFDPTKHLIRVQGNREYLPVQWRLVWFREAHPDWGIETEVRTLDIENGVAVVRATVISDAGRTMATATKMETARGFPDYLEKAETGAIGRALALCSFGTQFAPEIDEGSDVSDAPRERRGRESAPELVCSTEGCGAKLTQGQYNFSMGKWERALCPQCQKGLPK